MKRIPQLVTVSALFLSAGSALAQTPAAVQQPAPAAPAPVATQPAQPAPGDVSQINGQLVQVGDHNRFQYSYPRWNASTNPIGWVLGSYGVSLAYAPASQLALRGDVNYYNYDGADGFELGLGAPIYFRKVYSGFFLEPGFTYKRLSTDVDGSKESATVVGPQVSLGWHWYWDSGLNVQLSLGLGRNWNNGKDDAFADYNKVFGTGALRFGYAF
ncbi:hypothetical protein FGE12_20675 [Aggregicoccus sp. 17bor-14]|uniref:DUF3575 domain-containing protein n=1 Tax=Myxococcaceae TaxID=31 RepID=UPI00129C94AE|nr:MULTISPECIES: DUF3575 domain-containing protein [Myxococcaceae]MBF5044826.1 DUF3575 domain-containing protein [Simulacricoccus sp. 17bor-14]MRI90570.1 hypothetical protein [Aggregicoccus sp. 17bor-14]